jgi:SAM-dependent methyltransferase
MNTITTVTDRFWFPEPYARDEWVRAQAARLAPGSRVLDAGAGSCKYRPLFSHCQYETQDFCKYEGGVVTYAQRIDHVCDVACIPLPSGSFDAILCTEVIEHVVDPMKVVFELARLLKPGGKLLLTSPLLSHLHMEPYHYYGGFTHFWYRHWLPEAGLEIDAITPVGGPGQTCAAFGRAFYTAWQAKERSLSGAAKLISIAGRAPAKLLLHFLLPWTFPKLDSWLGSELICSGYMVESTRVASDSSGSNPTGRRPAQPARQLMSA